MNIRLETLGPARCKANGALTDLPAQKLRFALLTYLAMQRRAAREKVVAVFWPEREEDRARHTLAQTLYELRRTLGDEWLSAQPDPLEVTASLTVDAIEFEALVSKNDFRAALQLYRGEFLEGFHLNNSNEFESWVDNKRRELKRLYDRAARQHLDALADENDFAGALAVAQRWAILDPLDDEANHAVIKLLADVGQRGEAIAYFEAYERRIKEELEVTPLEQTIALIARIRATADTADFAFTPAPERTYKAPTISVQSAPASQGLFGELKRRRVMRMAGWYAASMFMVIQFAQAMSEAFYLPPWVLTATAALALAGFPVALMLSWQFDITSEGIRRTADRRDGPGVLVHPDWRLIALTTALVIAVAGAAFSTSRSEFLFSGVRRLPSLRCADGSIAPCRNETPMEPSRFVVLPLSHQNGVEPGLLDGEMCAQLLADGLSHWTDINVADQMRLNDALRGLSPETRLHIPVDTGLAIARVLGAGKLIMGDLRHAGDTTRVQATLYDASTGKALKQAGTRFPSGSAEAATEFKKLAQQLALQDGKLEITLAEAEATHSYAAIVAFDSAGKAMRNWKLAEASNYYRAALKRDADYAHAHLWLSYVMLWQNDTTVSWRFHADRARALSNRLGINERYLANGIAALARNDFSAACDEFQALVARDAASFYGWYGLSECLARDSRVLEDATSPSGWRFASSYEQAIRAHQRALMLVPSFPETFLNLGSSRLANMLFLSSMRYRPGVGGPGDTTKFAAYPELVGDTIRLVPYRYHEWSLLPIPPGNSGLIAHHTTLLRQAAEAWAQAFPDNTRALEALALSLEQSGQIVPRKAGNSAIDVVQRARKLETETNRQFRFDLAQVRLLAKAERYKEARRLTQRMLKDYTELTSRDAHRLAAVAGLVGKADVMAELMAAGADSLDYDRPASGETVDLPLAFAREVSTLLAYASFGAPRDSIAILTRRAHAALQTHTPAEKQAVMHEATLDRAARMLFPLLGAEDAHANSTNPFLQWQASLAKGDTAAVKRALGEMDVLQGGMRPSSIAADGFLTLMQLRLAVRDTAGAARKLDAYLADIANIPPQHFRQPYQPVSIVRLMAMRADLAKAAGDRDISRRWSRAVVDLWQDGDQHIKPTLRRMRSMARF